MIHFEVIFKYCDLCLELVLIYVILQDFEGVSVEYISMPGWKSSIAKCNAYESLPENARKYVETIEKYLSIPGNHISRYKFTLC